MDKKRDLRFVVIGAGMAGILSGIKLLEAGFSNICIYEKADNVGGTWRENTYPGLTCDVAAHAYTYSFEPNPDWSHYLAGGGEIQAYFERTTAKYGIDKLIRFNEEIRRCEFSRGRWQIETHSGTKDEADVVIAATGVLHMPSYPDIKGWESFSGAMFHSARWDHSVALDGKRVGVIGTGSTGVQIVSALSSRARKLSHFQRSAQWIMPVENPAFSEDEKAAFRQDAALLKHMQNEPIYTEAVNRFSRAISQPDSEDMREIEAIVLQNLEDSVEDPKLREKLRPNYRAACKRLVYSPDYYQAIQRHNVSLVSDDIECIESKGVRTVDGQLHEFDVLVMATGFQVDRFMRPMEIMGRDGTTLEQAWAKGPNAYMSISIPEFPNLFMLNGPNGPVGNFSLIEIAEYQWHYISQLIELIDSGECREVSASAQALADFDRERVAAAKQTIFGSGCKSWYLDSEGVPATWPWDRQRFFDEMATPRLEAYDLVEVSIEAA
ncbi:MAG: NAD(P)/FAD-dependent oxidoreductase [Halioglobus sp.]